ncbi:hypothetical protein SpCBS45565_g04338 [Spizellomyces sp. 'palustris']|nr:hypothetical protein SpCBS45565_g04338 [Spizellomyces sp. 'palustris']
MPMASPSVRQMAAWMTRARGRWEELHVPRFKRHSALADLVFGSAAGLTSKLIEHPFDTIKVRLQTQPVGGARMYAGSLDCLRKTIAADGPAGLFRGIAPPLVGSMLEHAVLFSAYVGFKPVVHSVLAGEPVHSADGNYTYTDIAVSGALAGVFASFVLTPLELIKCKQQVSESPSSSGTATSRSSIAIALETLKKNGISGLFRGQTGTLLREMAGGAAWFGIYEVACNTFASNTRKREELKPWELMLSGSLAGIGYNSALFPADVVKSIQQTEEEMARLNNTSGTAVRRRAFIDVAKGLYHGEGIKGFYRGFGVTLCRG